MKCPHCNVSSELICACGNLARYINERDQPCCGLCPLREKIESVRIIDLPRLWEISQNYLRYMRVVVDPPLPLYEAAADLANIQQAGADQAIGRRIRWWRATLARYVQPHLDLCDCPTCEIRTILGRKPT